MKKYLSRSLNRKLVVFMAAVLGSSLAVGAVLFIRVERANTLDSGKDKVRFFAEIIKLNVSQAMVEGRCEEVPTIIQTLQNSKDFKAVRILDAEGRIFESSQAGEKGKKAPFSVFHTSGKDFFHTYERNGEEFFCFTRPFHNEARCIRCHGEKDRVLGFLSVDLSLSSVEDKLTRFTRMHILLGFVVILMASGALFFFFSRFINRPIMEVSRKMAEVENGCFDVQLPVKSQDELGHLAGCFNLMAGNLQEMKKKDEEQQRILEGMYNDVQKRNQEISVLYQSFLAINRSLQIEEILRKTLEEVTESLDFDRAVLVVLNEKGDLEGKWSVGTDEDIVRRVQIPKRDIKGILYETYQKKEPILVKNTSIYPIIERRGARKCWEVLACKEVDCPNFQKDELCCWMIAGSRCHHEMGLNTVEEKLRVCSKCLYLNQEVIKRSDIVNLLLFGSHSFVSVPLIARDEVLGILLADKVHSQKAISEEDVKLLTTFISHISVALENAILYQKLVRKVDWSQQQLEATNEQLRDKVEELNRIRSFNESILQNLHGGIVSYTPEGTITFINKSGAELLGWTEAEVLGHSIHRVLCGATEDSSIFQVTRDGNGDFCGEAELLRKGGERIPVEIFLSRLYDEQGTVTGVTGIFQDITEKREIEARMRRVDKLASLGQLASGLAHEIKNPLAGIGSAIQVLTSKLHVDEKQKEVVQEILKQIHRLDGTIKNLLNFAKPGLPKLAPADPKEIIEAVIFLIAPQTKKQDVQIRLDVGKDLPQILVDAQKIQQAILNVVLNALEAMPSGGTLSVTAEEKAVTGPAKKTAPCISVTVTDTGTGIPDEVKAQIFNPFFTTKRAGTGLGLSITHGIIEQHHGRIDVRSEAGKGTVITIDLPV